MIAFVLPIGMLNIDANEAIFNASHITQETIQFISIK